MKIERILSIGLKAVIAAILIAGALMIPPTKNSVVAAQSQAPPTVEEARQFTDRGREAAVGFVGEGRTGAVGAGNFYHGRYGNSGSRGGPERKGSDVRTCRASAAIRKFESAARHRKKTETHQAFSGYSRAAQSGRKRRTFTDQCLAAERLRKRKMVPGRAAGKVPCAE